MLINKILGLLDTIKSLYRKWRERGIPSQDSPQTTYCSSPDLDLSSNYDWLRAIAHRFAISGIVSLLTLIYNKFLCIVLNSHLDTIWVNFVLPAFKAQKYSPIKRGDGLTFAIAADLFFPTELADRANSILEILSKKLSTKDVEKVKNEKGLVDALISMTEANNFFAQFAKANWREMDLEIVELLEEIVKLQNKPINSTNRPLSISLRDRLILFWDQVILGKNLVEDYRESVVLITKTLMDLQSDIIYLSKRDSDDFLSSLENEFEISEDFRNDFMSFVKEQRINEKKNFGTSSNSKN